MHSLFRIAGYGFFWVVMHYVCYGVFELALMMVYPNYMAPHGLRARIKEKMTVRRIICARRLFRTELYCVVAAALACYLLYTEYSNWPMDLLHKWGPLQEMGFEMAIAHWMLACIEDFNSGEEVIAHMVVPEDAKRRKFVEYFNGLVFHHTLTIAAYSWCLCTHYLSGLCVFGLLFELPIVLLNARDTWATMSAWRLFHDTPKPIADRTFKIIWMPTLLTWHLTRTAACLLWPLSLIIWRPELNTVPIVSRMIYHFLGVAFNYVNVKLCTEVVPACAVDDLRRTESKVRAAAEKAAADQEMGIVHNPKYPPNSRHLNTTGCAKASSLIGYDELAKHAGSGDLWVAVQGKVYNLTEFADRHPGGAEVIRRVAGKDASEAFLEAGHSSKARGMMDKYLVAHLTPHGYDQNDDQPLKMFFEGDISKKYEFGKKYTGYDHPMMFFMLSTAASAFLLASSLKESSSGGAGGSSLQAVVAQATALLLFGAVTALAVLVCVLMRNHPWYDRLIGISNTLSTNPLLSVLIYCFTTFSLMNAALLTLWMICDVCILSNIFLPGGSISEAITAYRISGMISLCAELGLKLATVPEHDHNGYLPLTALVMAVATAFDLVCFSRAAILGGRGDFIQPLLGVMFLAALARGIFMRIVHHIAALASRKDPDYSGPGSGATHYLLAVSSLIVAALLSFLVGTGLKFQNGSAETTFMGSAGAAFDQLWSFGDDTWMLACSLAGFNLLLLGSLMRESNAVFTSMTRGVAVMLFLWLAGPSAGYAQYTAFALAVAALLMLSKETKETLENKGAACPRWLYTAKQHEFMWRRIITNALHFAIGIPISTILHFLSPEYSTFFYTGPIMDLGDKVEVGVAYQLSAKNQGPPANFQCNVGYMKNMDELIRTGMATRSMLEEIIADPEAGEKGFVADIVAHFYLKEDSFAGLNGFRVREVNLSAWTSEKAAYNWYKNSPAHKEIVSQHYGGGLENFTPLLASLKPSEDRPIRYEVRCEGCRKVVKGPDCDTCPFCGEGMSHMPYF